MVQGDGVRGSEKSNERTMDGESKEQDHGISHDESSRKMPDAETEEWEKLVEENADELGLEEGDGTTKDEEREEKLGWRSRKMKSANVRKLAEKRNGLNEARRSIPKILLLPDREEGPRKSDNKKRHKTRYPGADKSRKSDQAEQ